MIRSALRTLLTPQLLPNQGKPPARLEGKPTPTLESKPAPKPPTWQQPHNSSAPPEGNSWPPTATSSAPYHPARATETPQQWLYKLRTLRPKNYWYQGQPSKHV